MQLQGNLYRLICYFFFSFLNKKLIAAVITYTKKKKRSILVLLKINTKRMAKRITIAFLFNL